MRENNRKPIEKCRKKLPQFTTMNVIDGQAGLVIYSSLIFYSLTIDNILNIVVLLILAGVTITALLGDDGIIKKAQTATEETRGASVEEEKNMWKANQYLADYTSGSSESLQELIDRLVTQGLLTEKEKDDILGNEEKGIEATGQVTIGSRTIVFGTVGKTLVQAFKEGEIKVGDYITNYNQKLKNSSASVSVTEEETGHAGTQEYSVDTSTTWRVLGLSEDEKQLIITTGSPIKKEMNPSGTEEWERDPYLYLNSGEGYYNTNDDLTTNNILDKICKIYDSTLAEKTQSMRIEDIMAVLDLTLDKENNKMYRTTDEGNIEITGYQGFFGATYTYKVGYYAPENYLKEKYPSKYTSLVAKKANDTVDGTAFMFSYEDPSVVDPSSKLYDILFKGTTSSENNAKAYWLASSGALLGGSSDCYFGPGCVGGGIAGTGCVMFGSRGNSGEGWLAVRPVVYLMSDVTVKDLSITEDGEEETWTTSTPNSFSVENLDYGEITD